LVDDEGAVMNDHESLLAFVQLVCGHLLGDRIALPVTATAPATRLAAAPGRRTAPAPAPRRPPHTAVHFRETKVSAAALADAATEPGVGFAADGEGGFVLLVSLPAFDAAAAFVKMLALLAREGRQLSAVREALPRVHQARETVV